jgi:mRNA interferase RelE/StbE
MAYRIEIKPKPQKSLAKIPNPHRRRIAKAIDALVHDARPDGCAKIVGARDAYRVRVGDYRIVYEVVDRVLVLYVIRIGHRKEVYRKL